MHDMSPPVKVALPKNACHPAMAALRSGVSFSLRIRKEPSPTKYCPESMKSVIAPRKECKEYICN